MSQFTNILKNGWHPEKQGTTVKSQMKGLVGRGDSKDYNRNPDHVSRPLHSLADPSTLPPPPQRRDTTCPPKQPGDSRFSRHNQTSSGEEPSPSPRPYRNDTTGLRTDHLPPPPGRRDGADAGGPSPPLYTAAMKSTGGASSRPPPPAVPRRASAGAGAGAGAPPPSLPPRLPPRSAASPQTTGITGIQHEQQQQQQQQQVGSGHHVNELQNRFARFHTSTSTPAAPAQAPAQAQGGTTWRQKQAALKTASQFQKDPSSVSLSDAKSAASTANNFRQRHGEQIAAGTATASRWNQKYGVTDKVGGFAQKLQGRQSESGPEPGRGQGQGQGQEAAAAAAGNSTLQGISGAISGFTSAKKKPPPPPSRKPGWGGGRVQQDEQDGPPPPPIPMSTRPNF